MVADLAPTEASTSVIMDVSDPAAWDVLVAEHGPFDVAFLNAGVTTRGGDGPRDTTVPPLSDLTDVEQYRRIMGANVDGVSLCSAPGAILPGMVERGRATSCARRRWPVSWRCRWIRSTASPNTRRRRTRPGVGAAVTGTDVHVSVFCPGFIETPLLGDDGAVHCCADMGVVVIDVDTAADAVVHVLEQRSNGAQWVLWGSEPPREYVWNPPI